MNQDEHLIQKAVVTWARAAASTGTCFAADGRKVKLDRVQRRQLELLHHSPNGGFSKGQNGKNKGLGVVNGWPDLFMPGRRVLSCPDEPLPGLAAPTIQHGLFLELKAPGGRVSPAQTGVHEHLLEMGYAVVVCRSFEEAQTALLEYLNH